MSSRREEVGASASRGGQQESRHTATEEIRLALEDWIAKSKSDPNVLEKAESSQG